MALNLTPLRINCSGFHTGRSFGFNVRYFPKLRTFSSTLNQFPQTKQLLKSSHVAMKKKNTTAKKRWWDRTEKKKKRPIEDRTGPWGGKAEFLQDHSTAIKQQLKKISRALESIQSISARSFFWCTGALTMTTEGGQDRVPTTGMWVAEIFAIAKHSQSNFSPTAARKGTGTKYCVASG